MKKENLKKGVTVIVILLIGLLLLTGCENTEETSNNETNNETDSGENRYIIDQGTDYINGYAWLDVHQEGKSLSETFEYVLVDKEGKIVFRDDGPTHTDVHSNYFVLNNQDLYNIQNGQVDLGEYNSYEKMIGTDNGERDVLELSNTVKNFEGTSTEKIYLDLTNMQEIEDIGEFVAYGNSKTYGGDSAYKGNYEGKPFEIADKDELDDFERKGKVCYKCIKNNGYFTVLDKENNQCFEPIEGEPLDVDDTTMSVVMVNDGKLYVVDLQGNKTEIPNFSYYSEDSVIFQEGMIFVINYADSEGEGRIFKSTGEEIIIHD